METTRENTDSSETMSSASDDTQPNLIVIESDNASENPIPPVLEEQQMGTEQPSTSTITSGDDAPAADDDEEERPSKKAKLDETIDEEGALCVICYEVWGQTGDHRIASLKCGHLFGHKCIVRWLKESRSCPTCKKSAYKKDIRCIYANTLIAVDTGETTRLQAALEKANEQNSDLQIELTSVLCKLALVNAEVEKYKLQVSNLLLNASRTTSAASSSSAATIIRVTNANRTAVASNYLLKCLNSIIVCQEGSCRVMDHLPSKAMVAVSAQSPNPLFAGFGVKQVMTDTLRIANYMPLHSKEVRGLHFNRANARLLAVSMDKHFSISNMFSYEAAIKHDCEGALWSCTWDASQTNIFHVGAQSVKSYDSRYADRDLAVHTFESDAFTPVIALASIPSGPGSIFSHGGFIACKLNSVWAVENIPGGTHAIHSLLTNGPYYSMTYNEDDQLLLVSARPRPGEAVGRHIICRLRRTESGATVCADHIHTVLSGRLQKQMSRTCFMPDNFVVTPNEGTVQVWDSHTGYPVCVGRTGGSAVIDMTPLCKDDAVHLLTLSDKKLHLLKLDSVLIS